MKNMVFGLKCKEVKKLGKNYGFYTWKNIKGMLRLEI
jgi:hypothetical protein